MITIYFFSVQIFALAQTRARKDAHSRPLTSNLSNLIVTQAEALKLIPPLAPTSKEPIRLAALAINPSSAYPLTHPPPETTLLHEL